MCSVSKLTSFLFLMQMSMHQFISPETELSQRVKRYRIKSGQPISLSCSKASNDVTWQFKSCAMNYKGMKCHSNEEFHNNHDFNWRSLPEYNGNKTLRIENASLEDFGIYRCIYGNLKRKIFKPEMSAAILEWPPPKVISVIPNELKIHVNNHLTINCSVSSRTPPKIFWFKVCWTNMCDLDFAAYEIDIGDSYNCLCLIDNTSNSTYNWENLYVSKLHIFNTHMGDGGTYVCSALSSDGKDHKNVTIAVEFQQPYNSYSVKSYLTLLIPLIFILVYILCYIYCARKGKKSNCNEQLQYLKTKTHVISVN